nr:MAG TPA: hypothetical protein [Caudoviricetes sp.]
MCRSGPMAPLLFTGQAGNRNVQVSVIGMHDMTTHHHGDTVWHLGRDEAITGLSIVCWLIGLIAPFNAKIEKNAVLFPLW